MFDLFQGETKPIVLVLSASLLHFGTKHGAVVSDFLLNDLESETQQMYSCF